VKKYFIIFLFLFLFLELNVFGLDYIQWFKEYKEIMMKEEIKRWNLLRDEVQKKRFIELFWRARDFNQFTERNEFKEAYQNRLKFVNIHFPNPRDPRRIIFLLLGAPKERRIYSQEILDLGYPSEEKIKIGKGEIWKYDLGLKKKDSFFIVLAKINPFLLEGFQNRLRGQDIKDIRTETTNYEILYLGTKRYSSIKEFVREIILGHKITESTESVVKRLKEIFIFSQARKFYQDYSKIDNYFSEERKRFSETLEVNKIFIQKFIYPKTIGYKDVVGILILCSFSGSILHKGKGASVEYVANLSFLARLENIQRETVIYHQKDIIYKLKKRQSFVYICWGSISPGTYRLILEIVDKQQRTYKKIEKEIDLKPWWRETLSGFLLAGRKTVFTERIEENIGPASFKQLEFFPILNGSESILGQDDSFLVLIYLKNFCVNSYGEVNFAVYLEIEDKKQVHSLLLDRFKGKVKDDFYYNKLLKKRVKDLTKRLKIKGPVKIIIKAVDLVANEEIRMVYYYPINVLY